MKQILLFPIILASVYLTSCAPISPVNLPFEKAGTLGQGNIELSGSYSHYIASADGESVAANDNYGVRAGFGISDRIDLKLRYEKLVPADQTTKDELKVNYISIIPKVSLLENRLAFMIPISRYEFKEKGYEKPETSRSYSIAPRVISTFTNNSNTVDFSFSAKGDYIINQGEGSENDFLVGINAGLGVGPDLNKWAVRPEAGYLFKPGEPGGFWSIGIGFQFIINRR